jgi:predicted RNA-binding protein with PUA-like domain
MNYWILKSEPDCYSIDDLQRDKRASWDGVRNYQARNYLRDGMKKGDLCVFYHSSTEPPCAAGVCAIVKEGYPDITQFDPAADHYDPKSTEAKPQWYMVDVAYKSTLKCLVPLAAMRANPKLAKMKLLQKGSRLSVLPLTAAEFAEIERMGAGK